MSESENSALPSEAEILKQIEENRVLIERAKRQREEVPQVKREWEASKRRIIEIIRQLART